MADANRQIVLDRLPQGDKLGSEHFRLIDAARPSPGDGEVLLRTRYISLDAANRAWMQGATYRAALSSGQVMAGGALAEVVESTVGHLKPGDTVFADTGWQDYAVLPGKLFFEAPPRPGACDAPDERRRRIGRTHRPGSWPALSAETQGCRRDGCRVGGGGVGGFLDRWAAIAKIGGLPGGGRGRRLPRQGLR